MEQIVLFADRPRSLQVVAVIVIPAVYGVISGLVLGASALIYIVLQVIGTAGGLLAGMEHLTPRGGAGRGALAGFVYGTFLLTAHAISGAEAEVHIGDPKILFVVVTTAGGALLCAAGAALRRRSRARTTAEP